MLSVPATELTYAVPVQRHGSGPIGSPVLEPNVWPCSGPSASRHSNWSEKCCPSRIGSQHSSQTEPTALPRRYSASDELQEPHAEHYQLCCPMNESVCRSKASGGSALRSDLNNVWWLRYPVTRPEYDPRF